MLVLIISFSFQDTGSPDGLGVNSGGGGVMGGGGAGSPGGSGGARGSPIPQPLHERLNAHHRLLFFTINHFFINALFLLWIWIFNWMFYISRLEVTADVVSALRLSLSSEAASLSEPIPPDDASTRALAGSLRDYKVSHSLFCILYSIS